MLALGPLSTWVSHAKNVSSFAPRRIEQNGRPALETHTTSALKAPITVESSASPCRVQRARSCYNACFVFHPLPLVREEQPEGVPLLSTDGRCVVSFLSVRLSAAAQGCGQLRCREGRAASARRIDRVVTRQTANPPSWSSRQSICTIATVACTTVCTGVNGLYNTI